MAQLPTDDGRGSATGQARGSHRAKNLGSRRCVLGSVPPAPSGLNHCPFVNWLVLRLCCPQAYLTVVWGQGQGPPQGPPTLRCLHVACASVREAQAAFA